MATMKKIDEMMQEQGLPSRTETDVLGELQPEHDPDIVAQAMRTGVPVEQMEARQMSQASLRPPMPSAGPVDPMAAYNEALGAAGGTGFGSGVVTEDTVREALAVLNKYHSGKATLEARVIDNEEYYRLLHNGIERGRPRAGKGYAKGKYRRNTAWLFTTIANKLADYMDNYPEATVLPREAGDEAAAKQLTAVIPAILERNRYKEMYRSTALDSIKNGCGIQHVLWDGDLDNGLGDVAIRRVDPLNIFWEPGVDDIQMSANVFMVELRRNEEIVEMYPQITDLRDRLSTPSLTVSQYTYNGDVDTSDKSYIVNWYYKRRVGSRTILHYCRFVNDVVLYASENDPRYRQDGWYRHGRYPFVFFTLYPEVGTPFGFGELDIGHDAQDDIDEINAEILRNIKQTARRRWFVRDAASINEEEYADLDKDFIHVQGPIDDVGMREIVLQPLSSSVLQVYQHKIDEIKETTANRDVNQGGVQAGANSGVAIAALQETGNKTSRMMIAASYERFREVCELIIELVRQFYDIPRTIRITGDAGQQSYMAVDNAMLQARQMPEAFGVAAYQGAEPVFDVSVKAYKENPYSRQQANQDAVNMYGMGFFQPENYVQALACLEMMDMPNKDKLQRVINDNGMQWLQAQQMAMQQMMAQQSMGMAGQQTEQVSGGQAQQTSGGDRMTQSQKLLAKDRAQAQEGTQPR